MAAVVRFVRLSSGGKALFLRHVKSDLGPITDHNMEWISLGLQGWEDKHCLCSAYVFIMGLSLLS